MWSVAVHWVCRCWVFMGGVGQGQLLPVLCPRSDCMSHKAICRWLLLVLGLEILGQSQAVNLGRLLLVPDLGPLHNRYGAWRLSEACCCLFERI